jgi:hypothetical protein
LFTGYQKIMGVGKAVSLHRLDTIKLINESISQRRRDLLLFCQTRVGIHVFAPVANLPCSIILIDAGVVDLDKCEGVGGGVSGGFEDDATL